VLEQEHHTEELRASANARAARYRQGGDPHSSTGDVFANEDKENENANKIEKSRPLSRGSIAKRDFFGRIIVNNESTGSDPTRPGSSDGAQGKGAEKKRGKEGRKVWLHYHEGFSNAVRKPITIAELMADL
jgi:chromosome transmission fidelity protein 18